MKRRIVWSISAAVACFLLLQAAQSAQDQVKAKNAMTALPYKLTATLKKPADIDTKQGNITMEGDINFVSPKTPPYKLSVSCHKLQANKLAMQNATKLTASDDVVFTALIEPKAQPAGQKQGATMHYEGHTELLIYEIAPDPNDPNSSAPAHLIHLLEAKNSSGQDVVPSITCTQAGASPFVITGPDIIYNLDTGHMSMNKSLSIEGEGQ